MHASFLMQCKCVLLGPVASKCKIYHFILIVQLFALASFNFVISSKKMVRNIGFLESQCQAASNIGGKDPTNTRTEINT